MNYEFPFSNLVNLVIFAYDTSIVMMLVLADILVVD